MLTSAYGRAARALPIRRTTGHRRQRRHYRSIGSEAGDAPSQAPVMATATTSRSFAISAALLERQRTGEASTSTLPCSTWP